MEQINYQASSATRINGRGLGKPNEDFLLIDQEHHIFILLDGITRVHQEYEDHPGASASCDVNEIFSRTVHQYLISHITDPNPDSVIKEAAIAGNKALIPYRSTRSLDEWKFYPGTLGIITILRNNQLHFLFTGDCLGTLIRNNSKLHFAQQSRAEALELMKVSKSDRYGIYCNHPEHPFGYGIFNGDPTAELLFEQASMEIRPGDTLILCTDGISRYMRYIRTETLISLSPEEMMDASCQLDAPPFAAYADDKAIIKLQF